MLSVEGLSRCGQTIRSDGSSVVDHTHWLVALIARYSDLVVLYDVLFNDGLARCLSQPLNNSSGVQISLWKITIIAGDVRGSLCCANSKEKV